MSEVCDPPAQKDVVMVRWDLVEYAAKYLSLSLSHSPCFASNLAQILITATYGEVYTCAPGFKKSLHKPVGPRDRGISFLSVKFESFS